MVWGHPYESIGDINKSFNRLVWLGLRLRKGEWCPMDFPQGNEVMLSSLLFSRGWILAGKTEGLLADTPTVARNL